MIRITPLFVLLSFLLCSGCHHQKQFTESEVAATSKQENISPSVVSPMFKDVSEEWKIHFQNSPSMSANYHLSAIIGSGCAILDIDRDGLLDVFFAGLSGEIVPNKLFRQTSPGVFEDVSLEYGFGGAPPSMAVAVGDANNDGFSDIYLASHQSDTLWLNRKGEKFQDVTGQVGLQNENWGSSATWCDYNRDGLLDLFVVNYVDYVHRPCVRLGGGENDFCSPKLFGGTADRLFKNVTEVPGGIPQFVEITHESGIGKLTGHGLGVIAADLTGDHWTDFYIANDQQANILWVNQQDGTFYNEAAIRGCHLGVTGKAQASMGLALKDLNGDLLEDLVISHLVKEPHAVYLAQPTGSFKDDAQQMGISEATYPDTGFGIAIEDFDHDGLFEIITANGHVKRPDEIPYKQQFSWKPYQQPIQILTSTDSGTYKPINAIQSPIPESVGRGLAVGDLNNDGQLDIVISNTGADANILKNLAQPKGDWIIVQLLDPQFSGRPAIGAKLTAVFNKHTLVRTFQPCASYASSHAPEIHLTAQNSSLEYLEVIWADGSSRPERFHVKTMNQRVRLERGKGVEIK